MNNRHLKVMSSFLAASICICSAISISGCSSTKKESSKDEEKAVSSVQSISTNDEAEAKDELAKLGIDSASLGIYPNIYYDTENQVGFQLEKPNEGDTIAVIKTSMGSFTIRFFPEQAPKAVTSFINLAKKGKYNGTTFYRAVKDSLIQGGHIGTDESHPNGISDYGNEFEDEFCDKLLNIRGAVSMANTSSDSNGSQFFINQTSPKAFAANGGFAKFETQWENAKKQLANYKDSTLLSAFVQKNGNKCYDTDIVSTEIRKLYEERGGNPDFDGAYNAVDRGNTVFAQVISGLEVVDKISKVEVDENCKPKENVVIEEIEIKTYKADTKSSEKATKKTAEKSTAAPTQKPTE